MRFVHLCVSFPAPVPPLSVGGGDGPVAMSPYLARGGLSPRGWACTPGAVSRPGGGGGEGGRAPGGGSWPAPCVLSPGAVAVPGLAWRASWVRGGEPRRTRGGRSSVPLPPLHRHEGWVPLRPIGHGGSGLHTARVRVGVLWPERRPSGPPLGGLVPWRAINGLNGQTWSSVTRTGAPIFGLQVCL